MRLDNRKFLTSKASGLLNGHRDYRHFVVLTRSRTGSSLLLDGLGSHPGVVVRGEVFRHSRPVPNSVLLSTIWGRHARSTSAVGFKIFHYHPNDKRDEDLWKRIADTPQLHVLHLEREDTLSLVLSGATAAHRNAYHNYGGSASAAPEQFAVDTDKILRDLERISEIRERRLAQFAHHRMLSLDYSELQADAEDVFSRCFTFLGIPSSKTHVALKPSTPTDYPSLIANYDTLISALTNAGWIR
ncbi:hypothetical protein [Salipiger thiooxidans]|uniref:hypothetical protein n=1 Tax=Salipiger thiooxidans TaxID=282683 RepID=UPI001CFBE7B6|nr:hypothetical protein [Salipiger thiooxidans]